MDSYRWQRVWTVFEEVIATPEAEQAAILAKLCQGDKGLEKTVAELLVADSERDAVLDRPPIEPSSIAGTPRHRGAEPTPSEPTVIGPYRLLRRLGQGGMGTVYLAVRDDDSFKQQVVVKLVRPDKQRKDLLRRLRIERQILASLNHPFVARLYEGGSTDDGLPYFVMEYVDGLPVDLYCDQNRLSVTARLELFRKILAAVDYAHRNLVVHRDLKPSNILVTAEGEPKLLDFGIAKLLNPALGSPEIEATQTSERVMTPRYASPEQIRGEPITTASDVYSLGVLLFKLLTGYLPWRSTREIDPGDPPLPSAIGARGWQATRGFAEGGDFVDDSSPEQHADARRTSPSELGRQLSGDLDAIVIKALREGPQERYSSVERFADDIERHLEGRPVEARRGTWRYRAGKFIRRNRGSVALTSLAVLFLVTFAAAMAWQSARIARERDQARQEQAAKQGVLQLMYDIFRVADPFAEDGAGENLTVREAFARSEPLLDRRLRKQPAVRAEILHMSGVIHRNLGLFERAAEQLHEAVELRRALSGTGHPDLAQSLTQLGDVLLIQGESDEAERLSREAVAMNRESLNEEDPARVRSLNGLVSVLCARRDYETAEPLATEAMTLARALAEEDRDRATSLINMAMVRNGQERRAEAVELYRQSLTLKKAVLGEEHPSLAVIHSNLGVALRKLERFQEAEQALRKAAALQRKFLGERHPGLIATLNNLGGTLEAQDRYDEALQSFQEALQILQQAAGPKHPRVLFLRTRILSLRIALGDPEIAARELEGSLPEWRETLGGDHRYISRAEGVLANAVKEIEILNGAEPQKD